MGIMDEKGTDTLWNILSLVLVAALVCDSSLP